MSGLPVPNTTFQDGVTRVISEWLNPVNDAMNFACGLVGLNDAGIFAFGDLYDVNDYVVYANQLYKCIAPIAPAVLAPDADTAHWALLANLTRSGIAQVPNIAALRTAVTASIIASTVFVHGYYTPTLTAASDGGGGFFIYDAADSTSPDDGGLTIVDASNRRWKRQYTGEIYTTWFGAKGDGVTDDTVALQNAYSVKTVTVRQPAGIYKTTAALFRGTSPSDRANALIMEPDAILQPTGTGYTVLTIYPDFFTAGWSVYVDTRAATLGARPALNGVYVYNSAGCQWSSLRVSGFNGFGLKLDRMWDTFCDTISVELSGNTTNYAFSLNAAGDTSNQTHIARLQVEQSDTSAIYFDPNNLNIKVSLIHSERTYANQVSQLDTWYFGGANCYYGNMGFTTIKGASYDGKGVVVLNGEHVTYENIRCFQDVGSTITLGLRVSAGTIKINEATAPSLSWLPGHNSPVQLYSVDVINASMIDTPGNIWIGGSVETLTLSPSGVPITFASAKQSFYKDVIISTGISQAGNPVGTFENCTIGGVAPGGILIFNSCVFPNNTSLIFLNWEANECSFLADLQVDSAAGLGRLINSEIAGALTTTAGANNTVNVNSRVIGAVNAVLNSAPNAGTWTLGERSYRITPVVGQPKSWVCTVSGTPGTWVSEGNL